jgi:hypothetical protein
MISLMVAAGVINDFTDYQTIGHYVNSQIDFLKNGAICIGNILILSGVGIVNPIMWKFGAKNTPSQELLLHLQEMDMSGSHTTKEIQDGNTCMIIV